jgi:DNA-binding CsgD family transcriptional regulator
MAQTLERLLAGDSEKQIARHLAVSPHTVHVYVKALYKRFGVCSRGELFARFVARGPAGHDAGTR